MLGNEEIFPSESLLSFETLKKIIGMEDTDLTEDDLGLVATFLLRGLRRAGIPYFMLFGVVVTYFVLKLLFFFLGHTLFAFCGTCAALVGVEMGGNNKKTQREDFAEDETTYTFSIFM